MTNPSQQELVDELRRRLDAWTRVPTHTRARYGIILGSRDANGLFTTEADGEGQPEPSSVAAIASRHPEFDPVSRLIWFLRHTDTLCIDGTTARIIARGSLQDLIQTIHAARAKHLAERYNDQGTQPVDVDPVAHRDHVIGLRLTDDGKAAAKDLEQRFRPDAPVESLAL